MGWYNVVKQTKYILFSSLIFFIFLILGIHPNSAFRQTLTHKNKTTDRLQAPD